MKPKSLEHTSKDIEPQRPPRNGSIHRHPLAGRSPPEGIKMVTASGWFAVRPSGTEQVYKIYAESFNGQEHLDSIVEEAQRIVDDALAS